MPDRRTALRKTLLAGMGLGGAALVGTEMAPEQASADSALLADLKALVAKYDVATATPTPVVTPTATAAPTPSPTASPTATATVAPPWPTWPRGFLQTNDYNLGWATPQMVRDRGCVITHMSESFPTYRDRDIAQSDLDRIRRSLERLRDEGMQTVFRFSYWYHWDGVPLNQRIDALPAQAHRHIDQLATVLNQFTDVILCANAGFVGKWGEWHYHDVTGPKTYGERSLSLPSDHPRANLLRKLLRTWNVPISLRYVRDLRWAFNSLGLSEAEKDRLHHNNDAVMTSPDEWGTFDSDSDRQWFYDVYLQKPRIVMGEFGESTSFSDQQIRDNLQSLARRDYRIHSWDSGAEIRARLERLGLWDDFERGVKNGW